MPGTILRANRAGRDPHRGLARRLAAAAAIVAQPVLDVISVVGVAGPVLVLDGGIVLRALVDIVDYQPDRGPGGDLRAGRFIVEHARKDAHLSGSCRCVREARLAGPALVEVGLDIGLGQRDAGRAAINHAADRRPVALAKVVTRKRWPKVLNDMGWTGSPVWYLAGLAGSNEGRKLF